MEDMTLQERALLMARREERRVTEIRETAAKVLRDALLEYLTAVHSEAYISGVATRLARLPIDHDFKSHAGLLPYVLWGQSVAEEEGWKYTPVKLNEVMQSSDVLKEAGDLVNAARSILQRAPWDQTISFNLPTWFSHPADLSKSERNPQPTRTVA